MTYDDFIENIKSSRGQWNIPEGSYWEGHHIIPKCLRGKGNSRQKHENIIWLYAKEHYIAHKLLLEKYPDNKSIILAFSMMAFPNGKTKRENMLTPEEYEDNIKNATFGEAIWATDGLEKFFAGLISVGEQVIARKIGRARKK